MVRSIYSAPGPRSSGSMMTKSTGSLKPSWKWFCTKAVHDVISYCISVYLYIFVYVSWFWELNQYFIHINCWKLSYTDHLRLSEQKKLWPYSDLFWSIKFNLVFETFKRWLQTSWDWQGTSRRWWWLEERWKDLEIDLWQSNNDCLKWQSKFPPDLDV